MPDNDTMPTNPKALVEFFTRSLTSFQSSPDGFRVICTLSHGETSPAPSRPSQTQALKNLIVLDSSFNPPTRAHAQMARSALEEARVQGRARLVLLLAVKNADKAPSPASFPLRMAMMHGFGRGLLRDVGNEAPGGNGAGHGEVQIDLAVTALPYFHDKARAISESGFYGTDGQVPQQTFLTGFDTIIRIFNPKYYTSPETTSPSSQVTDPQTPMQASLSPFFDSARLRVTMRPDDEWGGREEQLSYVRGLREEGRLEQAGGNKEWMKRVDLVEGGGEEVVSSSKVRELVRHGRAGEADGLVGSAEVGEWIAREELYRD